MQQLSKWRADIRGRHAVRRKSFENDVCPVARTLDVVGEWWTLLILRDAFAGTSRFSEFQKSLGMAKNILSARLQKLVENAIMELVPASDGSAYQEYRLTEKGLSLFTILVALRQWGEAHLCAEDELEVALVDRKSRMPVKKLELHAANGDLLGVEDLALLSIGEKDR